MHRRTFLAGPGAAGLALLAGCADGSAGGGGPRAPDGRRGDGSLRIEDFGTGATGDGRLLVWVVVENRGSERRTATVTVTARAANRSETRSVEVAVGTRTRVRREVALDVDADAFNESGSLDFRLS